MQARELYMKIWQELSRGVGADKSPAHIPESTGRAGDTTDGWVAMKVIACFRMMIKKYWCVRHASGWRNCLNPSLLTR